MARHSANSTSTIRLAAYLLATLIFILLCLQPFAPPWAPWLLLIGLAAGAAYCAVGWRHSRWKIAAAIAPAVLAGVLFLTWLSISRAAMPNINLNPTTTVRAEGDNLLILQTITGPMTPFVSIGNTRIPNYYYWQFRLRWLPAAPNTPGARFIPNSLQTATTRPFSLTGRWMIRRWTRIIRLPILTLGWILSLPTLLWILIVGGQMVRRRFLLVPPMPSAAIADKMPR
jgi:hypothetical protein